MNTISIHPHLPEISVPEVVRFSSDIPEIPVRAGDGDVYYQLGRTAFIHGDRGYAAFPMEIMSAEVCDRLGACTLDLFAIHSGSNMEPQEIVEAGASFLDGQFMVLGNALVFDLYNKDLTRHHLNRYIPDSFSQGHML